MATIRELGERGIVLRSLREAIDTGTSAGRAWWLAFWLHLRNWNCENPWRFARYGLPRAG